MTLPDGSPAIFTVTSQVNGPSAEVRGLELAWQHVFGDTGFGFQANATFVGTNKPYDPNDLSVSGFAVTGLANSSNFVPFYDKYGFQARVAVNHRSESLDRFGQTQNNSQFGTEPTFVNATTYVDFSTSYDINTHFNVYFDGAEPDRPGLQHAWPLHGADPGCGRHRADALRSAFTLNIVRRDLGNRGPPPLAAHLFAGVMR